MRKTLRAMIVTTVAMLLYSGPVLSASTQPEVKTDGRETVATIVVKTGNVKITRYGAPDAEKAKRGMSLYEGDTVVTGELSRAALMLHDGSMIKLKENSTMQLEIKVKNNKQNRLKVVLGQLWAKVTKQDSDLEIETPSAVAAIKGTKLELKVGAKETELTVWDGRVGLRNAQGNVMVGVGQRSKAKKGEAPSEPKKVDLEKEDDWFNGVVNVQDHKTLKTTIRDKDGKEHKLNIKYNKK